MLVSTEVSSKFSIRPHLLNGRLTVFLSPIENSVSVGEMVPIRFELQDPSMAISVGDELSVRIIEEQTLPPKSNNPKPSPKPKAGDKLNTEGVATMLPLVDFLVIDYSRKMGDLLAISQLTLGPRALPRAMEGTPMI